MDGMGRKSTPDELAAAKKTQDDYIATKWAEWNSSPSNPNRSSGFGSSNPSFGDSIGAAKDLAQWRLGLDKQSMGNSYDFRNREANRDFGFQGALQSSRQGAEQELENTRQGGDTGRLGMQLGSTEKLTGMQIGSNERLEGARQGGMNTRQTEQLQSQQTMQKAGFNQQQTMQAIQAARARSAFGGGRGF